jgi:hypothetical protein
LSGGKSARDCAGCPSHGRGFATIPDGEAYCF